MNGAPVLDSNLRSNAAGETKTTGQQTISSTFGEVGDLTDSGIFQSGVSALRRGDPEECSSGTRSRPRLKDFIAPIPINLTNCGIVNVKQDDLAAPLAGAVFTLFDNARLPRSPARTRRRR